ncbi:MAG: hypothetical protein E6Q97_32640 [Desulfurellales bacterium]|nr:MAG: hypothetical protein E6Q97_32640 [Desulfurellales bacterium]
MPLDDQPRWTTRRSFTQLSPPGEFPRIFGERFEMRATIYRYPADPGVVLTPEQERGLAGVLDRWGIEWPPCGGAGG